MYNTIVSIDTARENVGNSDWIFVDCRFQLADPEAGWRNYRRAHIPGARYAHLDKDLSGPPVTDQGRHPLPTPAALKELFGRWGIQPNSQVVAYDDSSGAIAARLWWLLHYMSHEATAVLDGGWAAWEAADLPTESGGEPQVRHTPFHGNPRGHWLVTIDSLEQHSKLIDSRAPERYRGEVEPLDPVAGHIPSAINYHFQRNWRADGRFLSPPALKEQLQAILEDTPPEDAVYYCGSGVTACANLLAQRHAGLPMGKLYAGSWSEWSRLGRPVARTTTASDQT